MHVKLDTKSQTQNTRGVLRMGRGRKLCTAAIFFISTGEGKRRRDIDEERC